jgi:hypothetical protein
MPPERWRQATPPEARHVLTTSNMGQQTGGQQALCHRPRHLETASILHLAIILVSKLPMYQKRDLSCGIHSCGVFCIIYLFALIASWPITRPTNKLFLQLQRKPIVTKGYLWQHSDYKQKFISTFFSESPRRHPELRPLFKPAPISHFFHLRLQRPIILLPS